MVHTVCGEKVLLLMQHIWVVVGADTIRGNIRHEGKLMCRRLHTQGEHKSTHIHTEYASETAHLTHSFTNWLYLMATIGKLLKMICLFCKRAL